MTVMQGIETPVQPGPAPDAGDAECVLCKATAGLMRLNDAAGPLDTPSLAPGYYMCRDFMSCLERAGKHRPEHETCAESAEGCPVCYPAATAGTDEPAEHYDIPLPELVTEPVEDAGEPGSDAGDPAHTAEGDSGSAEPDAAEDATEASE